MSFITILIPVYNGIEYLEECINSVIIQTFTDWKIIIGINGHGVDGGNVVSIVDQISKKDSRISYIIQPPPLKGKVESLNNLITLTTSPWISILDCDDIWEYYKLERQVDALNSDAKDASVIGTFAKIFTLKSNYDYLTLPYGYIDSSILSSYNPIVNSSSLIKRELCNWEYNEHDPGHVMDDYWLWMRICLKGGKLYNIPEYLTWHRIHKTSAFNSKGHSNEQLHNHYNSLINMKKTKIAFCFLIYDTIYHEELWNVFFKNIDTCKYAIYIHYKHNVTLQYFEKYKLTNCIETNYANVSLIHAHNILLKKAYDDGCDKMINLSQSCIPLKSFDHVYDFLTKDNFGHFNVTPKSQCFPRCNNLLQYYEKDIIQKSSEWFILNREICSVIINYDTNTINQEYSNIYSPEEHYYITLIFKNNLQNQIIMTDNSPINATTFTNWEGMDYMYPSMDGLKNYNSILKEELIYILNSKSLFGRKFNKECQNLYDTDYINHITSK